MEHHQTALLHFKEV